MKTDDQLEKEIAQVLKDRNGLFREMGLKPDDSVVCRETARYIVGLLNVGKENLTAG